jgi:Fe-S oxidoreductase
MNRLREIIDRNRAWYCVECGKCSAVCPVTPWEGRSYTTPRLLVEKALKGNIEDVIDDPLFWSCLTCKRCSQLCPSDVFFSEFVRDVRQLARSNGRSGECSHGEVIQSWGRMMTDPGLAQRRLEWLNDDVKISNDSDTLYFVGCLPYYDALFQNPGIEGLEIARAAVKILNYLGVAPQILADERCCGHDQIWEGDGETFQRLAGLNLEYIRCSGARRIVTTCPECARTLGLDYPKLVGEHGLEVLHLSQFIRQELSDSDLNRVLQKMEGTATYHDACRLGRHLGVYEAPRALIMAAGLNLVEMQHTRQTGLCCGTSCWTSCGKVSKNIQMQRLKEANATGAELLITACVKCQIHLKCAQQDAMRGQHIAIRIRDLTTVMADCLSF